MEDDRNRAMKGVLVLMLVAITAGAALDLYFDAPTSFRSVHVVYEIALACASAAMAGVLWRWWFTAERRNAVLSRSLEARAAERDAWRHQAERALDGLGAAIGRQFDRWGLTPSEREVALLLLKGRSHKEIAQETGRSERTARQHAVAVYQKAGLDGRATLAAFFLDALTVPVGGAAPSVEPPTN